jgi:hypothetical protein
MTASDDPRSPGHAQSLRSPAMQQGKRSLTRIWLAVLGSLVVVSLVGACSSGDDDASGGSTTTAGESEGGGEGGGDNPFGGQPAENGGGGGEGDGGGQVDPASLTGVWEGTYECAQGVTYLQLTIDDRGDGTVGAAFEFRPVEEASAGIVGGYTMTGSKTETTLTLEGQEWLEQPGDYFMVGLQAEVSDRGADDPLAGTVDGENCTEFEVERTSTDPWYVGEWRGAYGCTQGVTGLTLTIEGVDPGHVTATYEFYEVPENPGVPSGSFRMTGTYDSGRLTLQGDEWIEQPEGYSMVGYESNDDLGVDPHHMFGTVIADGCTLFTMDKVED